MSFQLGLHFNSVLIKFQDTKKNVPRVVETVIIGMRIQSTGYPSFCYFKQKASWALCFQTARNKERK